jgi:membrane-bound serine protease (ClpP class)
MMRLRAGAMLAAMALAALALPQVAAPAIPERAWLLEIDGVIGPPIADYIVHQLAVARPDQVRLIIVRMNTPGGLDTSMRQIISAILASPVPVVTYVAPNGARAASAGTYIAYASAIAAMAPGTNIGAATPVQLGGNPVLPSDQGQKKEQKQQDAKPGEPADAETRKVVNDAVAYIRSLAALHDRNADWAAEAAFGCDRFVCERCIGKLRDNNAILLIL